VRHAAWHPAAVRSVSESRARECAPVDPMYRNSCIVIVKALQKYGMVLVDRGNSIYAERLGDKPQDWMDHAASGYALPPNGNAALAGLDFNKFRAVEPVYP
jgi:hypothetical protein